MQLPTITAAILAMAALTASTPIPQPTFLTPRAAGNSAVSMLLTIAPTSNTCTNAPAAGECATATQAAPYLISAMSSYGITSPPELAAVLSLIAFESGDFKYNINHYPGRAGQGTRNMQMPDFNLQYAVSVPALVAQVQAITSATSTTAGLSDDQLNAVRALVLPDQYTWASAAWFYTTKCASVRAQVQGGGQAGLEAYLGCVGTTATSDRLAYWTRANTAFGLS
jgi:hypothetical protein